MKEQSELRRPSSVITKPLLAQSPNNQFSIRSIVAAINYITPVNVYLANSSFWNLINFGIRDRSSQLVRLCYEKRTEYSVKYTCLHLYSLIFRLQRWSLLFFRALEDRARHWRSLGIVFVVSVIIGSVLCC